MVWSGTAPASPGHPRALSPSTAPGGWQLFGRSVSLQGLLGKHPSEPGSPKPKPVGVLSITAGINGPYKPWQLDGMNSNLGARRVLRHVIQGDPGTPRPKRVSRHRAICAPVGGFSHKARVPGRQARFPTAHFRVRWSVRSILHPVRNR